jgi:hypothetical protein
MLAGHTHQKHTQGCDNRHVRACIVQAARKYRQSVADALSVAFCESSDDPLASNGTDDGLFQFAPSTFAATPYGAHSIWVARWNSLAAMWAWDHGWKDQWQCQ